MDYGSEVDLQKKFFCKYFAPFLQNFQLNIQVQNFSQAVNYSLENAQKFNVCMNSKVKAYFPLKKIMK